VLRPDSIQAGSMSSRRSAPWAKRPAVVRAGPDPVDLVVAGFAVLDHEQLAGRIPGHALRIAMAQGIDERARERVVLRRLAVQRHPQDLARQAAHVLRPLAVRGPAGGGVQVPVRPDGDAAAVVEPVARDAGHQHAGLAPGLAVEPRLDDLVGQAIAGTVGVVEVGDAALREVARQRHAEQPRAAFAGDGVGGLERKALLAAAVDDDDVAGLLGQQEPVAIAGDVPGVVEVAAHHLHRPVARRGVLDAHGIRRCLRQRGRSRAGERKRL